MGQKLRSQSGTKTVKDAYVDYAKKILAEDPELWSRYYKKTPHYQIFKRGVNRVIEVMSYPRYRRIVEEWFKGGSQYIIGGMALTLGSRLGRMAPRRIERNFKNKQVNWKDTKKMWERKGEKKGVVYFLDEDYLRIGWKKTGKLKNSYLYRFDPAEGNKTGNGFKQMFSKANIENPLLKMKYEYFPYIKQE